MSKQTEWGPDAVEMLRDDHRRVHELFQEFDATTDEHDKKQLAETALLELQIHAALEEELFYPAARAVCENDALLDRAEEEHHIAKIVIHELEDLRLNAARYVAKVTVLAESVRRHIQEEEALLFPVVRESGLDLQALGRAMAVRRQELLADLEGSPWGTRIRDMGTAALVATLAIGSGLLYWVATIGRRQTRTTKRRSSAKPTKQSTTAKHAKQHA